MQVAVDGPAGSGKSTVCKLIAEKYGLTYIDTGAMYRSAAYISKKYGSDNLEDKIAQVEFIFTNNGKFISVKYNGETYNLTDEIRTPEISKLVPSVAQNKELRKLLVKKQQSYALKSDVIMDGRDITTVVLPNADLKIYLTASAEERAKRRYKEYEGKNNAPAYEEVLQDIIKRDKQDMEREESPLMQAEDAILLDTTGLTLDEVVLKIGDMITKLRK